MITTEEVQGMMVNTTNVLARKLIKGINLKKLKLFKVDEKNNPDNYG